MSEIRDSTVLITGGAIGLGRLLARRMLDEGAARVVLWDIDEPNLTRTVDELQSAAGTVHAQVVDLSRPEAIDAAAVELSHTVGTVDILFNGAGVVVGRRFDEHDREAIERTIRVNLLGSMHVARVVLPGMIRQGRGHLVNVSSAAGLLPNPRMSVYVASKWGVLGWSESLRLELESIGKDLHVTTLTPGYIDTGMFEGVRAPLLTPVLRPDFMIDRIIDAIRRNRILVREPFMTKVLPFLRGVLPARVFDLVAGRLFGVYKTMDTFVGHEPEAEPPPTER